MAIQLFDTMAAHALQGTLDNLKEQIPDEVYRQLCEKTREVFKESTTAVAHNRRHKRVIYEVRTQCAITDYEGGYRMHELGKVRRMRLFESGPSDLGPFEDRISINFNDLQVGSVHTEIPTDEDGRNLDHMFTYRILDISDAVEEEEYFR